jgi:homoserine kinase type II
MRDVQDILAWYPQVPRNPRITPVAVGGFSGARVFHVETDSVPFCLKQWPTASPPPERLRELHRFLKFLQQRGVSEVAVPLESRGGLTLLEVEGRFWQLEPWKPGTADFLAQPRDQRLRNAMHALARLHTVAAEYVASATGREWFFRSEAAPSPSIAQRLSMIRDHDHEWLQVVAASASTRWEIPVRSLLEAPLRHYAWTAPTIAAELASLETTAFRLHPCLRDVWDAHVLFTGDEVTGIIDPGAARTENVASDLSRLLGSFLASDRPRWEFALSAYAEVRPLSLDERRLVRVLDRSGVVLSGLTWIERLSSRDDPGTLLPHLQRLARIAERMRLLAEEVDHL